MLKRAIVTEQFKVWARSLWWRRPAATSRYAAPVSDVSATDGSELPDDSDAETLLGRWRSRMLQGVIATCVVALVPAVVFMTWQRFHGVPGLDEGLWLGYGATLSLFALAGWRGAYARRAAFLIGGSYFFIVVAMLAEGFAPAQFTAVCTLTILGVLWASCSKSY
jgi:hypothetical protein